jgi:hypothetical protein
MDIHNYQPKPPQPIHLPCSRPRREQGFVLITVLLVMMLVVVIGLMATGTSTVELEVAAMDKFHEQAFAAGDSGVFVAPKVIGRAIRERGVPDNPNFSTLAPWLYDKVMGYADPPAPDAPVETVLAFGLDGGTEVDIDIRRLGQENLAGSGVEFGGGAAGVGAGVTGVQVIYSIDALGIGLKKSSSNIVAVYRRIPGTAGGL